MSKQDKINWLLILQGWTMLWVVLGHSPLGEPGDGPVWENAIVQTAYSFHMSLFMLISGFLFYLTRLSPKTDDGKYRWNYGSILKDKSIRLLVPMAFFTLFAYVLKWAFPSEMDRTVTFGISDICRAFIFPYNGPLREMWFVYTLFLFFVLTPLWRAVLNKTLYAVIAFALLLVCHFWDPDVEFLSAGRVLDYGIWFYTGLLLAKYNLLGKIGSAGTAAILSFGAVAATVGHLAGIDIALTTGLIAASIALAMILDRYVPRIFHSFRDYTYQIFLMGIFAQFAVKILFRHIQLPYLPAFAVCVAAGVYVPVAISAIAKKIGFRPLLTIIGLKP